MNFTQIDAFDGTYSTAQVQGLNPIGIKMLTAGQIATWRAAVTDVPTNAQVTQTLKQETLRSGVVKTEMETVMPVMEAISGQNSSGYTAAPKVAFTDRVIVTVYSSDRSTYESRRRCYFLAMNFAMGRDEYALSDDGQTNDTTFNENSPFVSAVTNQVMPS